MAKQQVSTATTDAKAIAEKKAKKEQAKAQKQQDELIAKALVQPLNSTDTLLYFIRNLIYIQDLMIASTIGALAGPILSLPFLNNIGVSANDLGVWGIRMSTYNLGIKTVVEGKEYLNGVRPAMFVCNHQSAMDLYALGHIFPANCVIMAKKDLRWVPFIGWMLISGRNIFIDRNNHKSAVETMKAVSDEMKRKKVGMFMFPEGTRSHQTTNELLPFKKGAFHLAIEGQMPIVPIVVGSYHTIYNSSERYFRGGELRMKVLPPIETKGMTLDDIDTVMDSVRNDMLKTLKEISAPVAMVKAKL
ncbi:1-acylglycerol-3-phosphate O-acyltransferase [Blyttiomyces sp. JEL0837]|nr:1-acylglycerol-3-phosphate O-acyltransferase [Blyttiomyces sp. JEL0837]